MRICVDGASNDLYNFLNESVVQSECSNGSSDRNSKSSNSLPLPEIICGDFDSVSPTVLDYFKKRKVKICPTPDQNKTDFCKALEILEVEFINKTAAPAQVFIV